MIGIELEIGGRNTIFPVSRHSNFHLAFSQLFFELPDVVFVDFDGIIWQRVIDIVLFVELAELWGPILENCLSLYHSLIRWGIWIKSLSSWRRLHICVSNPVLSWRFSNLGRLLVHLNLLHTLSFIADDVWQKSIILLVYSFFKWSLIHGVPSLIELWQILLINCSTRWLHRLILWIIILKTNKLHLAVILISIFILIVLLIILVTVTMRSLLFFQRRLEFRVLYVTLFPLHQSFIII